MTVHATPPHGEATTPCCDAAPFELPADDRMTLDSDAVTCGTTAGAFATAMGEERDIEQWQISNIIWNLKGCTDTVSEDRGVIAHVLWTHGITPEHLGECRADEEHSIYENECEPCRKLLLAMADRILSRVNVGTGFGSSERGRDD